MEVEKTEQAEEFWPSSERGFEVSHVDVMEEVAFGRGCEGGPPVSLAGRGGVLS